MVLGDQVLRVGKGGETQKRVACLLPKEKKRVGDGERKESGRSETLGNNLFFSAHS